MTSLVIQNQTTTSFNDDEQQILLMNNNIHQCEESLALLHQSKNQLYFLQFFATIGVLSTCFIMAAFCYRLVFVRNCNKKKEKQQQQEEEKPQEEVPQQQKEISKNKNSTLQKQSSSQNNNKNVNRSLETLLATQQQSIQYFFDNINLDSFHKVQQLLMSRSSSSLVHFCGVGKSGVVAQKLAVTLTSTQRCTTTVVDRPRSRTTVWFGPTDRRTF